MIDYNPDLSKTNKELFEEFYQNSETAVSKFNTWCDEENLYTDPKLCFHWQLFVMFIDNKRTMKIIQDSIDKRTIVINQKES